MRNTIQDLVIVWRMNLVYRCRLRFQGKTAWLLAKSPSIVPIPGTRTQDHLLENLGAQKLVLTQKDVQDIDTMLSKFPIFGERMGESHMSSIDYTL